VDLHAKLKNKISVSRFSECPASGEPRHSFDRRIRVVVTFGSKQKLKPPNDWYGEIGKTRFQIIKINFLNKTLACLGAILA
jgi:hypothetical protein